MKKILISLLIFFIGLMNIQAVAVSNWAEKVICNIGETDGALYASEWKFQVTYRCYPGRTISGNGSSMACTGVPKSQNNILKEGYYITMSNAHAEWHSQEGLKKDDTINGTFMFHLDDINSRSDFYNLGANTNTGISTADLVDLIKKGQCPSYIYTTTSAKKKNFAYIFSYSKVPNAVEIFENAGYEVDFKLQDGGDDLHQQNIQKYNDHIKDMEENMKIFDENDWGNVCDDACTSQGSFGGIYSDIADDEVWNIPLNKYNQYKEDIYEVDTTYDFSKGDAVYEKYKTYACKICLGTDKKDPELPAINSDKITCAKIFQNDKGDYNDTWRLLNTVLIFMQYLGIILATVLSIMDFIQVIPTQNKDAIKKASTKAVTRLIIAIVIFFVPIIIDFILGLVGFNNPTCGLL